MAEIALDLTAVDKTYLRRGRPPVAAVKALSMQVNRGEIVALLGSSGCGKTSTLRMIAGFETVTRGTVTLGGRRIENLPPAARRVAMAFEGYSLYPPLTVRDNIGFALKAARLPREATAARIDAVARLLEIGHLLDRYPSALSGGEQQRAGLARALVREADLYLLDEPMGQLEPQLRTVLRGRVKSLLNDKRMTAIFVTHDQTEANALADRIAVMEGGVLQQFGGPADLKMRPANLFVATFIGEPPMNVFDAAFTENGTGRFAIDNGPAISADPGELTAAVRTAVGARRRLKIGVRPHRVQLGEGPLRARVLSNQWLGDQTHVAAELAGRVMVAVAHDRIAAAPGAEIACAIAVRDLHLFDPDSGAALAHGLEAA